MSDQAFFSDSIETRCASLTAETEVMEAQCRAYLSTFPPSLSYGLFSADAPAFKEIASAYYEHAAALCHVWDRMEVHVLAIGEVMQAADQAVDCDTVRLCDRLTEHCVKFRGAFDEYLTGCEATLCREDTVSLSELWNRTQALKRHATQLAADLRQEVPLSRIENFSIIT